MIEAHVGLRRAPGSTISAHSVESDSAGINASPLAVGLRRGRARGRFEALTDPEKHSTSRRESATYGAAEALEAYGKRKCDKRRCIWSYSSLTTL